MSLVALVGLPGSGKSTIARRLAASLGWRVIDVDAEIERDAGLSIAEIFAQVGEERFRDLEQSAIAKACEASGACIATGGGAVLRQANRSALRRAASVVYLRCAPEQLGRRVRDDGRRPLLAGADPRRRLAELFEQRDGLYREVADLIVDVDGLRAPAAAQLIQTQLALSPQAVSADPEQRAGG